MGVVELLRRDIRVPVDRPLYPEATIAEKERIRGMSTPTSSSDADQDYRDIRRMDRLAALFVCQDKADVVAVAVSRARGGTKVYSVQDSGSVQSGRSEESFVDQMGLKLDFPAITPSRTLAEKIRKFPVQFPSLSSRRKLCPTPQGTVSDTIGLLITLQGNRESKYFVSEAFDY